MKEKNYWKMIGIDLLLNYSRVKWRKNLLRLETLASLLLQTLFPTVLSDLHHGILLASVTFICVHNNLVAIPTNLGPGVGGRSVRLRVGFGFGFGFRFEMATEWRGFGGFIVWEFEKRVFIELGAEVWFYCSFFSILIIVLIC